MKHILTILLFTCLCGTGLSQTEMPTFFSDGMVLQQHEGVCFWGSDSPNTTVQISTSWGDRASTGSDGEGKWILEVTTPPAGGPYSIVVRGSDEIEIKDVMCGEVWLCSGQSNMEMPVKGYNNQPVTGSNEAILFSGNDALRVFQVEKKASLAPVDDVRGSWVHASPSNTPEFSATAYFFGELLQEVLNVPVGLIVTSWGGSKAEAWMDRETLNEFDEIRIPVEIPGRNPEHGATLLYNGMLHPLIGYSLKGVIWYQGESNRLDAERYKTLFPALIDSWRVKWDRGPLPFYFVQIAPFDYSTFNDPPDASAFLRDAQLHVWQNTENTGMVVTADIGDCECIHPPDKKPVGRRLAYWALAGTYGMEGIAYSGPVYRSMEKTGDGRVRIMFDHTGNGLTSFEKLLTGFEIAGADRIFVPAMAGIRNDRSVVVWNDTIADPVAVRYAFGDCIEGTLFNTGGLPASPFRTDDWNDR
jgi:sialate O-acetylesterase